MAFLWTSSMCFINTHTVQIQSHIQSQQQSKASFLFAFKEHQKPAISHYPLNLNHLVKYFHCFIFSRLNVSSLMSMSVPYYHLCVAFSCVWKQRKKKRSKALLIRIKSNQLVHWTCNLYLLTSTNCRLCFKALVYCCRNRKDKIELCMPLRVGDHSENSCLSSHSRPTLVREFVREQS